MPNFPWGEEPEMPDRINDQYTIEVGRLCHDTHILPFRKIRQQNRDCVLKPKRKTGKKGYWQRKQKGCITYSKLLGASYTPILNRDPKNKPAAIAQDTRYRIILTYEAVLPGYYIWWSIHKTDNPPPPPNTYVSSLFSNPSSSVYGSRRISITSRDWLYSYQGGFAYKDGHHSCLQFRNGGTLRYKHEICYVVIVCAEGHFNGDDDYPVMDAFNINYEANGRIRNVGEWRVHIKNRITWKKGVSYSWDHFVFAFHYPTSKGRMHLPSRLTVHEDINHESCPKKDGNHGYKRVCPDKRDQRVWKRSRRERLVVPYDF